VLPTGSRRGLAACCSSFNVHSACIRVPLILHLLPVVAAFLHAHYHGWVYYCMHTSQLWSNLHINSQAGLFMIALLDRYWCTSGIRSVLFEAWLSGSEQGGVLSADPAGCDAPPAVMYMVRGCLCRSEHWSLGGLQFATQVDCVSAWTGAYGTGEQVGGGWRRGWGRECRRGVVVVVVWGVICARAWQRR
jgi:hypothetical protein